MGIGASAGGLEAFSELLGLIPPDTGMAFVVIQHLDPSHASLLSEAVARATTLPVTEIVDGTVVAANHVYVIPSNTDVTLLNGVLGLLPRPEGRRPHMAIDFFFAALAADRGTQAIGVVLSGTGSDGTVGLGDIKAAGGLTLAQDPRQAKFAPMPEAAIAAGVVDFTLPIPALAEELVRLGRRRLASPVDGEEDAPAGRADSGNLRNLFALVRNAVGVDLSEYKLSSVRRRLARRMAVLHIATLAEYIQRVRDDGAEAHALLDEMLIHVTSFFRDGAVFDQLKATVFPELLKKKRDGGTIRIWCAGCASGEEAYSIVIALQEFLANEDANDVPIQLFGTDISEKAIERARAGLFRDSALESVSRERRARYFTIEDDGLRISKLVRERCAFVKHDLTRDPPFSKIDLVCCRNVLIYFGAELQRRVLATFHFALDDPGFLLLGSAETISAEGQLFSALDKENRLYARNASKSSLRLAPTRDAPTRAVASPDSIRLRSRVNVVDRAESVLLERFVPPGVIVNERMEILQFRGQTAPYLEMPRGAPQYDLLKLAKPGLAADIRIATAEAIKRHAVVRRDHVRLEDAAGGRECRIVVVPLPARPGEEATLVVLFEDRPAPTVKEAPSEGVSSDAADDRATKLEHELAATKDDLAAIIEEHQRTGERFQSANEELLSSNEELQSLNEEMETAKEELQSTNEELNTLNEELQTRNNELNSINGDFLNILASVEVPIVIVDIERRIRRYTPRARALLNLLPTDVGRPIDDIKPTLAIEDLDRKIADVIESVQLYEEQATGKDGRWYRLQIRPYTSVEKKIDGAVLSIVDIDALKRALGAAEWARDFATAIIDASPTPTFVLTDTLRVLSCNEEMKQAYALRDDVSERDLVDLLGGVFDFPALHTALDAVVKRQGRFRKLEAECDLPTLGKRWLSLSGRGVVVPGGDRLVLLAVEDITERVRLLEVATVARASAEQANRAKDAFLATVTHELRTPLTSLIMNAALLRNGTVEEARAHRIFDAIDTAARAQAQLIDDLLNVSQIVAGKLAMDMHAVDLAAVVTAGLELLRPSIEKKQLDIKLSVTEPGVARVVGDGQRLEQVIWNLVSNAIKFTDRRGHISITLDVVERRARVRVVDDGVGIAPDFLPHIFERFSQEDRALSRAHGGLGLGLSIVRYIVEGHGGTISAESAGNGCGATFTVTFPLLAGPSLEGRTVSAEPAADIRGVRVLVVEDDAATRAALEEILRSRGANARLAPSAAAAMKLLEHEKPDIILSDLAMPEEDGYSFMRRVRTLLSSRDLPALALTAHATDDDLRRVLDAGFQDRLVKPVELDRLVAAIAKRLASERV